jgi:hypothetical protein
MRTGHIAELLAAALGGEQWPPPLRRHTGDKKYLSERLKLAMQGERAGERDIGRTARILGSLVLGQAAEKVFEGIYRAKLSTTEIKLVDLRESRNDTDFRLINGQGRPLYRLNIKFHGSLFRNALNLVGLQPEDCFPLASYKIKSALD